MSKTPNTKDMYLFRLSLKFYFFFDIIFREIHRDFGRTVVLVLIGDALAGKTSIANRFLENKFKELDLTLDLIIEKGQRVRQRNDLFFGTELIVGTPKRICEMYFQNGFNIGELKLFMLLDMNMILRQGHKGFVNRISESLPKCKKVLVETVPRQQKITDYLKEFMSGYKTVKEPAD